MIMQLPHYVVDCPICGCPIELESESLGLELACGHCHGHFVAHQPTGQRPIAATIREHSLLERADRILRKLHLRPSASQTVILVEHRDEVFARLAADIEQLGLVVVRAESPDEALRLVRRCDSALVVANRDLPGTNGWVLADKLNQVAPHIEVWLYMPQASMYAEILARFLKVSELLIQEGDLFSLSDAVTGRLADRRESSSASKDARALVAA
jgi:CheY-like chemotaxis protein